MKNLIFAITILIAAFANAATAQVKSVAAANKSASKPATPSQSPAPPTRARILGNEGVTPEATDTAAIQTANQAGLKNHPETARLRRASENPAVHTKPSLPDNNHPQTPSNLFSTLTPVSMASTQVYRVGPNDVLDIQIGGNSQKESTLFTVGERGFLEYPLAGEPISVIGLTTVEIAGRLRQRIKIFENPTVNVSVRDYASHALTVAGFVAAPGRKILRREAVPLYAILAESLVLPEAGRATINRQGRAPMEVDLNDTNHAATLVIAGDVIRVAGAPPSPSEFFFIGGAIGSPGQKPFHHGLTLTQALLASGGTTVKGDARIRVSRLGGNARLVTADYNLKKIQAGKVEDPVLEKGDRIEVIPTN